jgi:hypothetical protein
VDLHLGVALAIPKEGPFNYDLRKSGFATFLARNCDHKHLTEDGYVLEADVSLLLFQSGVVLSAIPQAQQR